MPGLKPGQPGIGRAGTGLGHLGQAEVDPVGQERCEQQGLVLSRVAGFEMREVPGETRPLIDLHK